jgi:hypothetical protein
MLWLGCGCSLSVSAYSVRILLHICPHSFSCMCVRILLHMCLHTSTYVSSSSWNHNDSDALMTVIRTTKNKKTKTLKKSYKALTPWSFVPPKKKLRPGTLPQEVCVCVCMCVRRGRNSKRLQCGLMGPPRGHRHPNYTRNCELTNI